MLVAKTSSESRGFLDNHHWSLFVPKSFRKTYRCPSKGRKGYVDRRFIWKRCIKFSHTIQVCKFTFQCNAGARCIVDLAEVSLGSNDEVQPPVPSYWKAAIRELPTNIIRVERNLFSNLQALPAGLMWVGTVIIESCGLWSTKTRSFLQRGLYYPSTGSVGLCTALKRLILHSIMSIFAIIYAAFLSYQRENSWMARGIMNFIIKVSHITIKAAYLATSTTLLCFQHPRCPNSEYTWKATLGVRITSWIVGTYLHCKANEWPVLYNAVLFDNGGLSARHLPSCADRTLLSGVATLPARPGTYPWSPWSGWKGGAPSDTTTRLLRLWVDIWVKHNDNKWKKILRTIRSLLNVNYIMHAECCWHSRLTFYWCVKSVCSRHLECLRYQRQQI